ncbi:MAG: hypothetical protein H6R19_2877, partial [Proteobacteria bacterium]|nr:hypothetical protein [Pseudomonadota bacterium]
LFNSNPASEPSFPEVCLVAQVVAREDVIEDRDFHEQCCCLECPCKAELRYLVETFESAEKAQNRNFETLLSFSLGKIDDVSVMNALGIDSEEDLFLLMAQARLPMPRLPDERTQEMADSLSKLVL